MKRCIGSIICLVASAIGSFALYYAQTYQGYPPAYRNLENLLKGIPVPHVMALPMVLYIGRRHVAAGLLGTLSFLVVVAISIAWPLAFVVLTGPAQMLSLFLGLGVYAAVLFVLPLLCLLTHLAARRYRDHLRGFPILPVSPRTSDHNP